jgi:hypothetical protein
LSNELSVSLPSDDLEKIKSFHGHNLDSDIQAPAPFQEVSQMDIRKEEQKVGIQSGGDIEANTAVDFTGWDSFEDLGNPKN